jgi:DNA-binding beta-propeller fold protein YncE
MFLFFLEEPFSLSQINIETKWMENGIVIDDTSGQSHQTNKLCRPQGIYVDHDNQNIYIADTANHRIIQCNSQINIRQVVAGGKGRGKRMDQLDCPTDVTVNEDNGDLIICDCRNRRVVR